MKVAEALEDLATAWVAGYVGTKAMEPVSMKLYELEPARDRAREDAARPGPPYELAAKKIFGAAGIMLEGKALERASMFMHYGLALSWSPLYVLLRRRAGMGVVAAGLLTGTAMSLIADETMTPLAGFSAPNRAYPLVTHLRGFAAHQVFGLAVAATCEALWALRGRRP
ncbi:DUF1440 domain-containing protein [Arthrobacter sp. H-02-3]|uniref:DUF1440 domain-containing protein n=1 Tax=Arthrobacter sp. H-02-3 TaxID=2703675 RepID=UPI000DD1E7CE|nr:DUF1440 domain-containing protein [Arthrobacter sp. H-02-3]PVZ52661.1 DUF1440 domain-containing protein [Arthrobacter sp. H-02-3]